MREYDFAALILEYLKVNYISLITNNPKKIEELIKLSVRVNQRIPIETNVHCDNQDYLKTKVEKMHHLLSMPDMSDEQMLRS